MVPVGNFKVLPSFSDVGQQLKNITGTVSEINSVLNSRQASGNRARCPEQSFVGYAQILNFCVGNNAYDDPKIRFVASVKPERGVNGQTERKKGTVRNWCSRRSQ